MGDEDIVRAARARHSHPFLNTRQAGHYLGLSVRFLERMRSRGQGPVFRRHGRYVLYHIDDLDSWSRATDGPRVRHD
ncbi:helix-turn-helix domain-containing protein [Sphingosinicella sp. LHD-64]|uniref:helix-turn-helix domain-containing protein n=1 Tax=Sphingosinicella sp. LHD-64 TaxID=3072139 RepID=UPI00280EF781|nr:helix-turn-helix domain-containing protein [Sphingosinicella sp. LHD-64]MDQ8757467.1 helix-turn-helix domain-containing protein [Sphingosinicella sp. LHD-64]